MFALVCLGLAVSGGAQGQRARRLDDGDCVDDKDWYHKNRGPEYDCAWVAGYPSKRCDVKGVDNVRALEACKATCGTCGDSDVVAFWYKPHYQCGASAGSTPDAAAAFINAQMDGRSDFVGIGEWAPIASGDDDEGAPAIGSPDYGSVAAVCGYGSNKYTTSVELFHDKQRWDLVASHPSSPNCADVVPLPPWDAEGFKNAQCIARTSPGDDDCCSCTFSEEEYRTADEWGQGLGQRPWVAGIYKRKTDATELCVVAGEFPHPLANQTLWNLNGAPTWSAETSA